MEQDNDKTIAKEDNKTLNDIINDCKRARNNAFYEKLLKTATELRDNAISGILLPLGPIECAGMLIRASYEREATFSERINGEKGPVQEKYYTVDDLRQIAEHLLVHCNHMENDKED